MAHTAEHANGSGSGGHPSVRTYILVFLGLMVGTVLTVVAAFQDFGWLNPVIALGIAVAKAVIVILFFMHVKYSTRLTWATVIGGFFWLMILLTLTLTDYISRPWEGMLSR